MYTVQRFYVWQKHFSYMFKRYKRKRYILYSAIYTQCNVLLCGKNTTLTCSKCCKIGSSKDKYWRKLSLFKLFFKDVNNT